MTTPAPIDPDRIPHETRRALDAAAVLVDTLDPGLSMRPEPEGLVVLDAHGTELATIPRYRLAEADLDRLWPLAERALERVPPHLVDQVLASFRDNDVTVVDDPTDEWVHVLVGGARFVVVHRSHLVDGWPAEEVGGGVHREP